MLHYKVVDSDKIIKFYGITQEPKTKNYVMVLDYAQYGSLRNYLDKNYDGLSWSYEFSYLEFLASGLEHIHKNGLIHRDLHSGNILVINYAKIADMGLCKPADYDASENTKNSIYGVLPYIAPEILRGQNYTKAGDIVLVSLCMN
jgi:serine/threonine protein kinase